MTKNANAEGAIGTGVVGDVRIDAFPGPILRLSFPEGHVTIDGEQATALVIGLGYCLGSPEDTDAYFSPDGVDIEANNDGSLLVNINDYGLSFTPDEAQALLVQVAYLMVVAL